MALIGSHMSAPIVLIIFNRPQLTQLVFEQICMQKPEVLYVISDGPRPNVSSDDSAVFDSRSVTQNITWTCDVRRIYSAANLGCRNRVVSGLNQVFTEVPNAIVLEDDCIPHQDFFRFANELLNLYESQEQVFSIGGNMWEFPDQEGEESYFASKYFSCWGWATWADRWNKVDHDFESWKQPDSVHILEGATDTPMEFIYWKRFYDMTFTGEIGAEHAWDLVTQWSMWRDQQLSLRPNTNLVQNLGLGHSDATHTKTMSPAISGRKPSPLAWPLKHPEHLERHAKKDLRTDELRFGGHLRRSLNRRA